MGPKLLRNAFMAFARHEAAKQCKKHGWKVELAALIEKEPSALRHMLRGDSGKLDKSQCEVIAKYFHTDFDKALELGTSLAKEEADRKEAERLASAPRFLAVPFSREMAMKDGEVPVSDPPDVSEFALHRSFFKDRNIESFQAFQVPDAFMEAVLSQGDVVLADLEDSRICGDTPSGLYALHLEKDSPLCDIRRVTPVPLEDLPARRMLLAVDGGNVHPAVHKTLNEVTIIGRIIMAWKYFR